MEVYGFFLSAWVCGEFQLNEVGTYLWKKEKMELISLRQFSVKKMGKNLLVSFKFQQFMWVFCGFLLSEWKSGKKTLWKKGLD